MLRAKTLGQDFGVNWERRLRWEVERGDTVQLM
jgi:hypothetical protein